MQIQNTSCQISTGWGFWVRIVSFTVQLSVKEKPQKHSYQSVRPVTVNVSRNVIISVSTDSITILLQQGPVSCLCFLNQRRRSSDWACSALTLVSLRLLSLGFGFFIKRSIIHITKTNKYVSVYKCIFMVLVVNGIEKYLTSV